MKLNMIKMLVPKSAATNMIDDLLTDEFKNEFITAMIDKVRTAFEEKFAGVEISKGASTGEEVEIVSNDYPAAMITMHPETKKLALVVVVIGQRNELAYVKQVVTGVGVEQFMKEFSNTTLKEIVKEKIAEFYE